MLNSHSHQIFSCFNQSYGCCLSLISFSATEVVRLGYLQEVISSSFISDRGLMGGKLVTLVHKSPILHCVGFV